MNYIITAGVSFSFIIALLAWAIRKYILDQYIVTYKIINIYQDILVIEYLWVSWLCLSSKTGAA